MRRRPLPGSPTLRLLSAAPALGALLTLAALLATWAPALASAEPFWPTYHRDAVRSGFDPEDTTPATPSLAWHSRDLGAPIWSQPLVLGSRVYVATVGDKVFSLDAESGAVVWETSVGTPVPASALPCGDVQPTVGIVGTPVIDPAAQMLYAIADTWDGEAHHELVGLRLSDGAVVLRTPVDPPGADPKAILQRTALNLDAGRVVFGFGGNDGDCSTYYGWLVAAPQAGGSALFWHVPVSAPSPAGGAIWAPAGPAVGPEGYLYATTGNPVPPPGQSPGPYDYSDSVVQLTPTLEPIGSFEPPNWLEEGENDLDLSSAAAELLPGGLLFQAGKDGHGYLVDEATMAGKPGAPAVFEGQVCGGRGSFGGDAFAGGVIYVPCTNGVQALSYDQAGQTFAPLWKGPADAFGPPTVAAGLVWDIATGSFDGGGTKLYGLDPATGVPRYTLDLPSPVADHFASSSAAGGRLFLATGSSETAFEISSGGPPAPGGAAPGTLPSGRSSTPSRVPTLLRTRLRAGPRGRVRIALRCLLAGGQCKGTITLRAKLSVSKRLRGKRIRRTVFVTLGHVRFNHRKGDFVVTLKLTRSARTLLRRHRGALAVQVVLAAPPSKTVRRAGTLTEAHPRTRR